MSDRTLPPPAETTAQDLTRRLGLRVRKCREMRGIPRRILSDQSGVSPRYLAQLEAGDGNISVGLLHRVATALDITLGRLLAEEDPWTSDIARATTLFRRADPDTRAKVLDLLATKAVDPNRAGRICLLGLRGAGKSTLGAAAASVLGLPFVELNQLIEAQAGMPVNEILALYGQEGYRRLEAQALSQVATSHTRIVLAVAGGIVSEPDTYQHLLDAFHTVWIKAAPSDHMNRVRAQGDTRPMAGNPEAMDQLRWILSSREALYSRAVAQLETSGRTVDESVSELVELIRLRGFASSVDQS